MNWPVVEVVIGLAFFFWLMSVLASAINEAIANVLALRSKGLTRGLTSMLGEEHVTDFLNTAIVLSQRKTPKPGQTSRRPSRQPSYLSASLFAEGLQELFGQRGASFRLDLAMVTNQHLRSRLETFADKVDNDSVRFRKELEDWFDATMERVSGWYKRRSHLILFLIGITVAGVANLSAVSIGQRLWSDSSFRSIVNAEATQSLTNAATTTTTPAATPPTSTTATTTTAASPGPLERARDEFGTINQLGFPAGWGHSNLPQGAGWLAAIFGWLLTAFAVTLGAPFWFDVLGKVANLRSSGPVPAPTSIAPPTAATTTPTAAAPTWTPALANRMTKADRALVVVSATSISGEANLSVLYRALDIAGPAMIRAELSGFYASIAIMSKQECTRAGIVAALQAASAGPAATVDLILMVHGAPDVLVLAGDTDGNTTDHVEAVDFASDLLDVAGLHDKLRLCYSTACYGASHAQALLGAGFVSVIGARGVNSNSATELPVLLRHWSRGDTIGSALHHADNPTLRAITDTIAKHTFPDANSQKVLVGDTTTTIDTQVRAGAR